METRAGGVGSGTSAVLGGLGWLGGQVLAGAFGLAARLRGTRALHPVGFCGTGRVTVEPGPRSGVVLLDEPGPHECLVRWSRATGLGDGPDVEGFAVRLTGRAAGDVLLASTGTGVVTRHVLMVRGRRSYGPLTTLLPVETARGRLLLRVDPVARADAGGEPPTAYRLLVAAPGHPWHERGRLEITWSGSDCTRRHDPVGHAPTGTWTSPLWTALRHPSYAASQRVRADPEEPTRG